jgi:hypothetical protein
LDHRGQRPAIARIGDATTTGIAMSFHLRRFSVASCVAVLALSPLTAAGETGHGDERPAEIPAQQQRPSDEFAEAARVVNGPAGNPECVWLGRRVVAAMWRDDMDAAYRHLEIYDRFGCPGPHIQATFRCAIRHGATESATPQALNARVHACWLNPSAPQTTAAPPPASTGSASR